MKKYRSILVLEDGTKYYGWSFKQINTIQGEVVFNTGMTGYQEIVTDPSYNGQIIVFTYPEIGNTGINREDNESKAIRVKGVIVKNFCLRGSNWRNKYNIKEYLLKNHIPHIFGVDTRSLTQHLRNQGVMNGCITHFQTDIQNIQNNFYKLLKNDNHNLVKQVTAKKQYLWTNKYFIKKTRYKNYQKYKDIFNILVIDFGVKFNILNILYQYGCNIVIVPAETTYENIIKHQPDGILLSNGPGDPSILKQSIKTVERLTHTNIPLFGICMGHQILSLALGGITFKLKFGHRGLNHPSGLSQTVEITSQNHGFAVKNHSLSNNLVNITHFNLNDGSIGGIVHKLKPIFSVQYHPEASPGPHDSNYLFEHFIKVIQYCKYYE